MSQANDKCQPFFQVLKKAFQWDTHCEEAITTLKTYLSSPPILVSPSEGELLTLYLAVSDFSTSAVLIRDKDRVQHPVYYCSRAVRGAKERYPRMEKLILALVTAARKLRPYFQAHTIEVPTEYLMKQVLHKPETSGRLMKWALELSEFDIRYKPKTEIKWQVLADFVMDFTLAELAEASDARPPHLEAVRRRGRQCSRERGRANSDLPRRNRYRVRTRIWVLSLQQRGRV